MFYAKVMFISNGNSFVVEIDCRNNWVCCQAQSPLPPYIFTQIENESKPQMLWTFGRILPKVSINVN